MSPRWKIGGGGLPCFMYFARGLHRTIDSGRGYMHITYGLLGVRPKLPVEMTFAITFSKHGTGLSNQKERLKNCVAFASRTARQLSSGAYSCRRVCHPHSFCLSGMGLTGWAGRALWPRIFPKRPPSACRSFGSPPHEDVRTWTHTGERSSDLSPVPSPPDQVNRCDLCRFAMISARPHGAQTIKPTQYSSLIKRISPSGRLDLDKQVDRRPLQLRDWAARAPKPEGGIFSSP